MPVSLSSNNPSSRSEWRPSVSFRPPLSEIPPHLMCTRYQILDVNKGRPQASHAGSIITICGMIRLLPLLLQLGARLGHVPQVCLFLLTPFRTASASFITILKDRTECVLGLAESTITLLCLANSMLASPFRGEPPRRGRAVQKKCFKLINYSKFMHSWASSTGGGAPAFSASAASSFAYAVHRRPETFGKTMVSIAPIHRKLILKGGKSISVISVSWEETWFESLKLL